MDLITTLFVSAIAFVGSVTMPAAVDTKASGNCCGTPAACCDKACCTDACCSDAEACAACCGAAMACCK